MQARQSYLKQEFDIHLPKLRSSTLDCDKPNCRDHAFCMRIHEFNDQSKVLEQLNQPISNFNGDQLQPPVQKSSEFC